MSFYNIDRPQLLQAAPSGDFTISAGGIYCAINVTDVMYEIVVLNSSGTGVGAVVYNNGTSILVAITAYAYASGIQTISGRAGLRASRARSAHNVCGRSSRRSAATTASFSWSGKTWDHVTAAGTPSAFTPAYIGFGAVYSGGNVTGRIGAEWFNKV